MDASTRPPHKRHRAAAHLARCLVAIYIAAAPQAHSATNNQDALPATKPLITAPAAHDIAITTVKPGQEGLELSARFSEENQELVQGISWNIRNESGDTVFNGITTMADAALPPGDYQVEAAYGTAHILQGVSVHEGTRLSVSFILNAGGLRVLPRIKGVDLPEVASRSMVYALSGIARGQLITTSHTPGEIIKITAGDYRIESRFDGGNAVAVTEVHVKPGIMSAVEIDHLAGVAQLSFVGPADVNVQWTITDEQGATLAPLTGLVANLVLKPGSYVADATVAGKTLTAKFNISAGQMRDIILGN
jgi:hypothetical protein